MLVIRPILVESGTPAGAETNSYDDHRVII